MPDPVESTMIQVKLWKEDLSVYLLDEDVTFIGTLETTSERFLSRLLDDDWNYGVVEQFADGSYNMRSNYAFSRQYEPDDLDNPMHPDNVKDRKENSESGGDPLDKTDPDHNEKSGIGVGIIIGILAILTFGGK